MPVSLGTRPLAALAIPLREGLKVSGTVTFQGSAAAGAGSARQYFNLSLEPADGRSADLDAPLTRGPSDPNGTFTTMAPAGKHPSRVRSAARLTLRDPPRSVDATSRRLPSSSRMSPPQASSLVHGSPIRDEGHRAHRIGQSGSDGIGPLFPVEQANWVDTDRSRVESRLRAPARTAASPSARCRRVNTTWWRSRNRPRGTGRTRRTSTRSRAAPRPCGSPRANPGW